MSFIASGINGVGYLAEGSTAIGTINPANGEQVGGFSDKRQREYAEKQDAQATGGKAFYEMTPDHLAQQTKKPGTKSDYLDPDRVASHSTSESKERDKPGLFGKIKSAFK